MPAADAGYIRSMRLIAALLLLLPHPALAWDFAPTPICTLTHRTELAEVTVTFDPALPEYAIRIELLSGTWPMAPEFAIAFSGGAMPLTIRTTRHMLSDGDRVLTVRDRGFGNVLDGLEFQSVARAISGARIVDVPLAGAAGPVRAFRACPEDILS